MKRLIFAVMPLLFICSAIADTIYMTDGEVIKNVKNIKEDGKHVYFEIDGWEGDTHTYNKQFIKKVVREPITKKKAAVSNKKAQMQPNTKGNETFEAIKRLCSQRFPSDYNMQEFCIKNQKEAIYRLKPIIKRANKVENDILGLCASRFHNKNLEAYDWSMVEFCYKEQAKAYTRLKSSE